MSNLRNNKNLILIGSLISLFILVVGFGIFYIFYSESSNNTQATAYTNTSENSNNKSTNSTSTFNETDENISPNPDENILPNNTANPSNDFIFPNSSVEILRDYQLASLNKETLALARNEIFARHGYIFQQEPFKSYFPKKSWYKPNPNFKGSYDELNEAERYNVDLIKKYENR